MSVSALPPKYVAKASWGSMISGLDASYAASRKATVSLPRITYPPAISCVPVSSR